MAEAQASLARGQAVRAARCFMGAAQCQISLGHLVDGRASVDQAEQLAERTGTAIFGVLHARELLTAFVDDEVALEKVYADCARLAPSLVPAQAWAIGPAYAICARTSARLGRRHEALEYLDRLRPWLERAPAWTYHFPHIAGYSAETLWLLHEVDHGAVVERAVRERVLAPDFRDIGVDSRLSLARLCTLQDRYDEARQWFAEARRVLLEQGARPLLAIADFDEALMYLRRDGRGDDDRARTLVDAGRRQFEAIGMTGWIRRTEDLGERLR
jgi:tetratricopeptide (TPR) repeat protein